MAMEQSKLLEHQHHHGAKNHDATALSDILLFFACGMGASLCYTATLSSLVYFKAVYGPASFVYLNLGVFCPLVPIALAQARYDHNFDKSLGSSKTFVFRGTVGFVVSIAVTALVPTVRSLAVLVGLATVLGTMGAVLQGTFNQMASFVSFDGHLKAAVSSGLQASAVVPLVVSYGTGFGSSGSDVGFQSFFGTISCVEGGLFGLFLLLMYRSRTVEVAMVRRDSALGTQPPPADNGANYSALESAENSLEAVDLSYSELWRITSMCCGTLVITLIPSFMVDAWFTQVKSDWIVLPQVLFYTRIAFDFSGRLATLLLHPFSVKSLATYASWRLLLVATFFVVAKTGWHSNQLSIPLVAVIGFASGYLVTGCFQLAPGLIPLASRHANVSKQASLLNAAFSFAAVTGLFSSFLLLFVL